MRAVVYDEYGGPDVLHLADVDEVHAGPGQVRVRVAAVSVNPIDHKLRSGAMADGPLTEPQVPGYDAAGRVDEVGDGASAEVGDLVFGYGSGVTAEYAVLDAFAEVPAGLDAVEAAALPMAVETAARALALLDLAAGDVVVLDGAAGGVGSAAVQLAVARGLRVVGTASEANQGYLRELGALATGYGDGLVARVRALVDGPIAGAVDLAGRGGVAALVELTGDPHRVVTIADFGAGELGVQVTGGPESERAWWALDEVADLVREGRYRVEVAEVFGWDRIARAHALSETGHVRGKIIVTVG